MREYKVTYVIKGTESVILSDPLCKADQFLIYNGILTNIVWSKHFSS